MGEGTRQDSRDTASAAQPPKETHPTGGADERNVILPTLTVTHSQTRLCDASPRPARQDCVTHHNNQLRRPFSSPHPSNRGDEPDPLTPSSS